MKGQTENVKKETENENVKKETEKNLIKSEVSHKKMEVEDNSDNILIQSQNSIIPIIEPTELGESLKMLNEDLIESQTRMTSIDMRARLANIEISNILAMDALVQLNVLPVKCLGFTRQKKRLSVSLEGRGRNEFVQVVAGKRELEEKTGFIGRIGNVFKKNQG